MRSHAKTIVALLGSPEKMSKKRLMAEDDDEEEGGDIEEIHADYRAALESGDDAMAARLFAQMVGACGE